MATIHLTEAARHAIQETLRESGQTHLRLKVTDMYEHELSFGTPEPDDAVVEHPGVLLLIDPVSALRGEGVAIDMVVQSDGAGFVIHNPNQPRVKEISASALKVVMESGGAFVLMDARTPEERAIAMIPGSRLLDEEGYGYLLGLDRTTAVVFACHHGVRSLAAAEHCLRDGFINVFNLTGGIDAWSLNVDPSVPRY